MSKYSCILLVVVLVVVDILSSFPHYTESVNLGQRTITDNFLVFATAYNTSLKNNNQLQVAIGSVVLQKRAQAIEHTYMLVCLRLIYIARVHVHLYIIFVATSCKVPLCGFTLSKHCTTW